MVSILAFGALLSGSIIGGQTREIAEIGYFICHHKLGAGNFARLLKMVLSKTRGAKPNPFIDCDDLKDLDKLFDYVGSHVDTFIIVCSKELLLRIW